MRTVPRLHRALRTANDVTAVTFQQASHRSAHSAMPLACGRLGRPGRWPRVRASRAHHSSLRSLCADFMKRPRSRSRFRRSACDDS